MNLAQDLASSTAVPEQNPVFSAAIAAFAAEEGDRDLALRSIERVGRGRLQDLLQTSSWLITMFCLAEAAAELDDAELAAEVYDSLTPYAHLPIMGSIGVSCMGSSERSLGLAARVTGRLDDAVAHLERAVRENQRLGNRPMTAITRADLAETLVMRDHADDRKQASQLIDAAIDAAQRMDLDGRLRRWKEVRERIEVAEPRSAPARCVHRGREWEIIHANDRAVVTHSVGMAYLASLLAAPGREITAGELAGVDVVAPAQRCSTLKPCACCGSGSPSSRTRSMPPPAPGAAIA